ncbi:MAG TPA: ATP-binding cassette domain-containing protein [Solirubrobacteraceae bacterium]|jgi:ABC-2 type transport system ATP-binding protein|nr:ATP-binding cassette domain-containing protein [Solirubrobacteraceae bacterium]
MPAAIEATDLRKHYPPNVQALDGISLTVESGTIFGVLGPNGAGKSTLTRVLCTLTSPDSGGATVAGIDVLKHPVQVRRAIGVVGQKHGSDPNATGRENLVLHGEFNGLTGRDLKGRVATALERFELVDAADRQVRTYSGGMARRLDIAMGLLNQPRVLFMDEPTTGLDPEARALMWTYIEQLAAEEQMTIWLTTHYMDEADTLTAHLAIVDRGRIVAQGTPDQLKRELSGDALLVELVDPDESRARSALARIDGVHEIEFDGRMLRARAQDGAATLPAVLGALDDEQVKVASVKVARPSLDDVYLRHAGRAFEQAEAESSGKTA